jgi:hypothetical protein
MIQFTLTGPASPAGERLADALAWAVGWSKKLLCLPCRCEQLVRMGNRPRCAESQLAASGQTENDRQFPGNVGTQNITKSCLWNWPASFDLRSASCDQHAVSIRLDELRMNSKSKGVR